MSEIAYKWNKMFRIDRYHTLRFIVYNKSQSLNFQFPFMWLALESSEGLNLHRITAKTTHTQTVSKGTANEIEDERNMSLFYSVLFLHDFT